tara:strand:+ start:68 stop:199 length:132 start_codon:yes stop_codon:yes gene_type:complete
LVQEEVYLEEMDVNKEHLALIQLFQQLHQMVVEELDLEEIHTD